jgi:DNA polymerase-1
MEFSSFLKEYIVKHEVKIDCHTITDTGSLDKLVSKLNKAGKFAVNLVCLGLPAEAGGFIRRSFSEGGQSLVGISICFEPMSAYYIPVGHNYLGVAKQLDREYVLNKLKPVFESNEIKKYVHNLKFNLLFFRSPWVKPGVNNIDLKGVYFDTMIASYLLNPSKSNHSLDTVAFDYLQEYKRAPVEDLTGKGKSRKTMDKVSIENAAEYACAGCDGILRLGGSLEPMLKEKKLYGLLRDVEMQLAGVLADMEEAGIRIDVKYLNKLSKEFNENIVRLVKEIHSLAGGEFNLNSTKQLGFILFEKHKLPVIRRTKTGYSTNEEVLKTLSSSSQLAAKVLEYRELQKLKSTYIDALMNLVDRETDRIHTSFNQTVTSTGRLSSSEPNLQNIPIRTELGRKIRRAFIPEEGCRFISADYSQIDLRVLAHLSGDEILCKAFRSGGDVHNSTACEIFGVSPEEVTGELRRIAKMINFGIVYGMSAYGLSQQLGISTDEAQKYIDNYFNKYSGVKTWTGNIIKRAHKDGYVTTLLNRIRYLPDINSKNKQMKSFAERTAVNTPVQGGASDIIKIAMININEYLKSNNFKSRMLLQVHDELLFEVPEDEISEVGNMVKTKMESAIKIDVPLVVDIKQGKDWNDMKPCAKCKN